MRTQTGRARDSHAYGGGSHDPCLAHIQIWKPCEYFKGPFGPQTFVRYRQTDRPTDRQTDRQEHPLRCWSHLKINLVQIEIIKIVEERVGLNIGFKVK